jgi:uncharacterized RDD family membrane protein YckC
MTKAGFFRRFLAAFIDGLLFGGCGLILHNGGLGLLSIVYETILISQWDGFTVGKKILGIKVVTTSGGKVDWVKAFIRSISKILSALPLGLGYFWMLWDDKSQTWHDKIADTFVVEA